MSHQSSAFLLNVLNEHWDIGKFRSSLGHKVNHSFTNPNTISISVIHPRYGPIKAFLTTKKIKKGEEILTSYDYPKHVFVPSWYAKEYEKEFKKPWPGGFFDESDDKSPVFL